MKHLSRWSLLTPHRHVGRSSSFQNCPGLCPWIRKLSWGLLLTNKALQYLQNEHCQNTRKIKFLHKPSRMYFALWEMRLKLAVTLQLRHAHLLQHDEEAVQIIFKIAMRLLKLITTPLPFYKFSQWNSSKFSFYSHLPFCFWNVLPFLPLLHRRFHVY